MTVVDDISGDVPAANSANDDQVSFWKRLDRSVNRIGDHLNPILVKETRQALKSRQFVITFSLLLLASFGWSVAGSVILMPGIYYSPSAPTLLLGYYFVLAVPMMFVVPLAAYRSLASEIDDGTLELLRVTTLSPMELVMGKLCSALVQMMLYFVALVPCVAYAYALRGIDLPSLIVLLGIILMAAIQLTIFGIFLAPLANGRTGQLTTLVLLVGVLLLAEYAVAMQALDLILQTRVLSSWGQVFLSFGGVLMIASTSYVMLAATAAQLAPACANRSTRIRVALLVQQIIILGLIAYGFLEQSGAPSRQSAVTTAEQIFRQLALGMGVWMTIYWTLVGSMMAAETPVLTPRVRRTLPQSFFSRFLLTFFIPGPATGVAFAAFASASVILLASIGAESWDLSGSRDRVLVRYLPMAAWGYMVIFLILVRGAAWLLRKHADFRPGLGLAILVIVGLISGLLPFAIYMVWEDYPSNPSYSKWQLVNFAWTMAEVSKGERSLALIVFGMGCVALIGHLATLGRMVLPQRIPTPERVQREQERLARDNVSLDDQTHPLGEVDDRSGSGYSRIVNDV